jgi:TolA-binding protein
VWPDERVVELVDQEFVPVRVHVQKQADEYRRLAKRYGAEWTPTILMLDPEGEERHRMEGYLPTDEFVPQLEFGAARIAFSTEKFDKAEERFRHIVDAHHDADVAPEALYWAGVAKYKASNDAAALKETADALKKTYPASPWAKKASVWAGD